MTDQTNTRPTADLGHSEPDLSSRTWTRSTLLRAGMLVAAPLLVIGAAGRAIAGALTAPFRQAAEPEGAAPEDLGGQTSDVSGQPSGAAAQPAGAPTQFSAPLQLTPEAVDADDLSPTHAQTEGPYFKRNSPERTSLVNANSAGTPLGLTGQVLTQNGKPVARALLDFWQADARGQYDNSGFTFRGHQFTDENGRYTLDTVVAGLYPGRTRHIHVKVQAPNGPILTTQLYWPNESRNAQDGIFDPALLMKVQTAPTGQSATFDFVVRV
jgi:protocatechuate 3,4-dioxygenase beta subunit